MLILPAIDLLGGQAVRLYKGDYSKVTVYDPIPLNTARAFEAAGAQWLHLVDLDGAKSGGTDNFAAIRTLVENTRLNVELGGGVRTLETIARYLSLGVRRVVLGTAAAENPDFAAEAAARFGAAIAVGVDLKDGKVAVKGWTQNTGLDGLAFCQTMEQAGVKTIICTDIARDGAMAGTNRALYGALQSTLHVNLIASGGVSSLEDIQALARLGLYGAIVGKAYYTGAIDLGAAISLGKGELS